MCCGELRSLFLYFSFCSPLELGDCMAVIIIFTSARKATEAIDYMYQTARTLMIPYFTCWKSGEVFLNMFLFGNFHWVVWRSPRWHGRCYTVCLLLVHKNTDTMLNNMHFTLFENTLIGRCSHDYESTSNSGTCLPY